MTVILVTPAPAGIHLPPAFFMEKQPCVYILASRPNGTLYIGVTTDLVKRMWEHRNDLVEGFTKTYGVHQLVYYELHADMTGAITREKQLKKWNVIGRNSLSRKPTRSGETFRGIFCERLDSRLRGNDRTSFSVIPAEAGIHLDATTAGPSQCGDRAWIPASAGMTERERE